MRTPDPVTRIILLGPSIGRSFLAWGSLGTVERGGGPRTSSRQAGSDPGVWGTPLAGLVGGSGRSRPAPLGCSQSCEATGGLAGNSCPRPAATAALPHGSQPHSSLMSPGNWRPRPWRCGALRPQCHNCCPIPRVGSAAPGWGRWGDRRGVGAAPEPGQVAWRIFRVILYEQRCGETSTPHVGTAGFLPFRGGCFLSAWAACGDPRAGSSGEPHACPERWHREL